MNPIPIIISFSPTTIDADSADLALTITGTNFISSSVVYWAGVAVTTVFVSSTQLTATVPQACIPIGCSYTIMVNNPPSTDGGTDGGNSNIVSFLANLSLAQAQDLVTGYIDAYRIALNGNYCTYESAQWDIDPTSIANISGIITIGMLNSSQLPSNQQWRDYNNNMVDVTFAFMAGMAVSIGNFVESAYQASWTHKANVLALTDTDSVLAYDFIDTLWPDPNTQY